MSAKDGLVCVFAFHIGRPSHSKTISVHPAWLLVSAGLRALCVVIGLFQGTYQPSDPLALALLGLGLALLWLGLVVVKPDAALLLYTVFLRST